MNADAVMLEKKGGDGSIYVASKQYSHGCWLATVRVTVSDLS